MVSVHLRFDDELHSMLKEDKDRLGLNWENYIITLFGFSKGVKIHVKGGREVWEH